MTLKWFKKKDNKKILTKCKNNNILIVDDSKVNRYVIKKTIENLYPEKYHIRCYLLTVCLFFRIEFLRYFIRCIV